MGSSAGEGAGGCERENGSLNVGVGAKNSSR